MTAEVDFTVDLTDPATAYTAAADVGTVWEVGINGVGYMLFDRTAAEPDLRYRRQRVPLEPQRFATGTTSFNEAVMEYNFVGTDDWSGGAGQRRADRDASQPDRFFDSLGVNPFVANELTLLHSTTGVSQTHTALRMVVVGTDLYIQTGAKQITKYGTVGGAGTAFTIAAATTITDLCTDGVYWYAAAGAQGIFRGSSAADPGAAWSAITGQIVDYVAGRIATAYASSGSAPNRWSTLTSAGLEEVASGRITLEPGTTITGSTGGSGFVWFGAYAGDQGWVYKWPVSAAVPSVVLEPLPGQAVREVFYEQGQLMVRTETRFTSTTSNATIYRCPIDANGVPTPFAVVDLDSGGNADFGPGAFCGFGDLVLFSWKRMDGTNDGIGALDLTTGGYAKWHLGGTIASTALVRSIVRWQNRLVFSLDAAGFYYENTTYLTTGYVTTSSYDLSGSASKVYDYVTIISDPLLTAQSVAVSYSTDGLATFAAFSDADLTGVGLTRKRTAFAKKAQTLGLKLTLTGPGTSTPKLTVMQMQLHRAGISDTLIQLPVACSDHYTTHPGRPPPGTDGPGSGAARARLLEGLSQSRILFQDVDYAATQATEIFDVLQTDVQSVLVSDRHQGKAGIGMVVMLTLRKAR